VNLLATQQLARANRESMNIRGSYLHLLTDRTQGHGEMRR
jgi:hypothetical protein